VLSCATIFGILAYGRGRPSGAAAAGGGGGGGGEPVSTLNEELRRLTPDLVYQEVLATLLEEPVND